MAFNQAVCYSLATVWASILALEDPDLAVVWIARNWYGGRSLNVEIASARARAVDFQLFVPQKKLDTWNGP